MKLKITVDQKTYEVDVEVAEDDRPQASAAHAYMPSRSHGAAVGSSSAAAAGGCSG